MQEDDISRYVDEFGEALPVWKPLEPDKRGRHKKFASAAKAAYDDLIAPRDPFIDSLADVWEEVFPGLPARPGRYEDGKIFLYVRNSATLFAMRPRLAAVKKRLAALPGAPAKIELRLEIKSGEKRAPAAKRREPL